ncbi:MAG: hypothetical protein NVS4B3_25520 [Gemmatimonadaceae bacterium]
MLAISANPRQVPPPTVTDYLAAFDLAYGAGARGEFLSYTWSALEPDAGRLDVRQVRDDVAFARSRGMKVLLGIQTINTTAKETPADLQTIAFDDARMKGRFHTLVDSLAPLFGDVAYISVGNEVGVYLTTANAWPAYTAFYSDAVAYVHAKAPAMRVGATTIYSSAAGPERAQSQALNAASDVIIFTYYPLGASFHPTGPLAARDAFPGMISLAAGKPVIVQELGYPSAVLLNSSEADQAAFVTDALAQWTAQSASAMPFVNIFLLHDLTQAQCDAYGVYYGLPTNADFKAYLCSLGMRRTDGTPKAAWPALVDAARRAGVPTT